MFNQSGLLVVNLFDSRLEWEVQWRVCLNIGQLPYHILNPQPGGQSSSGTRTHNVPLTNRTAVKVSDTLQLQSLISNHRLISLLHRICVCKRCDQPCGALLKRKQLFDLCQMANVKAGTLWCLLHGIGFALTRRLKMESWKRAGNELSQTFHRDRKVWVWKWNFLFGRTTRHGCWVNCNASKERIHSGWANVHCD